MPTFSKQHKFDFIKSGKTNELKMLRQEGSITNINHTVHFFGHFQYF